MSDITKKSHRRMKASVGAKKHARSIGGNIVVGIILTAVGIFLMLPLIYAVAYEARQVGHVEDGVRPVVVFRKDASGFLRGDQEWLCSFAFSKYSTARSFPRKIKLLDVS